MKLAPATSAKTTVACGWAAVLCAVLFAQTYVRARRPDGIDLTSYLMSARALWYGSSPYLLPTPFPYLYPATLAFLLIPLTFVPATIALLVWFGLNVVAVVLAIRALILRWRPELIARPGEVAMFLALFFTFFFSVLQSNLRNGQVNFLVLCLCVSAGLLFFTGAGAPPPARTDADASRQTARHSRRRRWLVHLARPDPAHPAYAALFWSLAVAIKLVPLALFPFFALRRSWLWLLASVLAIGAWCLLPAIASGSRIIDIYHEYWRVLLVSSFGPRVQPLDFSLAGTIAWATGAPLLPALEVSAAAVVVGWIVQADGRRLRSECVRPSALYLLAIPLVSPQSEVHHLAFMLPAAAIAGAEWWRAGWRANRALQISTAIAAALYLTATAVPIAKGPLYCAALIAFGVALMSAPGRLKPATTETSNAGSGTETSGGVRL